MKDVILSLIDASESDIEEVRREDDSTLNRLRDRFTERQVRAVEDRVAYPLDGTPENPIRGSVISALAAHPEMFEPMGNTTLNDGELPWTDRDYASLGILPLKVEANLTQALKSLERCLLQRRAIEDLETKWVSQLIELVRSYQNIEYENHEAEHLVEWKRAQAQLRNRLELQLLDTYSHAQSQTGHMTGVTWGYRGSKENAKGQSNLALNNDQHWVKYGKNKKGAFTKSYDTIQTEAKLTLSQNAPLNFWSRAELLRELFNQDYQQAITYLTAARDGIQILVGDLPIEVPYPMGPHDTNTYDHLRECIKWARTATLWYTKFNQTHNVSSVWVRLQKGRLRENSYTITLDHSRWLESRSNAKVKGVQCATSSGIAVVEVRPPRRATYVRQWPPQTEPRITTEQIINPAIVNTALPISALAEFSETPFENISPWGKWKINILREPKDVDDLFLVFLISSTERR